MGQLWFAPSKTYNDIHEDTVFARPADILSPGDPYSAALTGEGSIRRWLRSQVIRCFTPDPTNTLMWSHYAESHKGVCVGFSLEKLKQKMHGGINLSHRKVRYSSTPTVTYIGGAPSDEVISRLATEAMLSKSIHWAYEKEHRFYTEDPGMANNGGGLIDVGSDAVVEVIFGTNVSQETMIAETQKLPKGVKGRRAYHNLGALSYDLQILDIKTL